jgi:hypothetical protein
VSPVMSKWPLKVSTDEVVKLYVRRTALVKSFEDAIFAEAI